MVERLPKLPFGRRCEHCGRPSATAYCDDCLPAPEHPVTGPKSPFQDLVEFDRRWNGHPCGPRRREPE